MAEGNGKLSIAEISCENILMIEKLAYKPRPGINIFAGKNKQGKTDVLRLVKAGLKGCDATIITTGKESAKLMFVLNDGHEIRRSVTQKSKRIQVRTPEGDIKASPQAYLDALLGDCDLLFDPVEFALLPAKEQKQYLLDTWDVGKVTPELLEKYLGSDTIAELKGMLDFSQDGLTVLKGAENILYTERSAVNKIKAQRQALYDTKKAELGDFDPETYEDRTEAIDAEIEGLKSRLSDAQAAQKQAEQNEASVKKLEGKIVSIKEEVEGIPTEDIDNLPELETEKEKLTEEMVALQNKVASLMIRIDKAKEAASRRESLKGELITLEETLKGIQTPEIPDIKVLTEELSGKHRERADALVLKQKSKLHEDIEGIFADLQESEGEARELTEQINTIRKEIPNVIFRGDNLPFTLEFDGDHVIFDGARIENMATSEQLGLGLEIVRKRNEKAKLKLICVDKLETLDDESYEAFWKFCEKEGFQAFCTKVIPAKMPDDAVIIENGALQNAD